MTKISESRNMKRKPLKYLSFSYSYTSCSTHSIICFYSLKRTGFINWKIKIFGDIQIRLQWNSHAKEIWSTFIVYLFICVPKFILFFIYNCHIFLWSISFIFSKVYAIQKQDKCLLNWRFVVKMPQFKRFKLIGKEKLEQEGLT